MTRRVTAVAVAILTAGLAGAQGPADSDAQRGTRFVSQQRTFRSRPIDTRWLFPQVSRPIQQRPIVAENPSRGLRIPQGRAPRAATPGMTARPGPRALPKFPGVGWSSIDPGDPDVAVGPNHLVQVVNSQIAFFSKAGTKLFQQPADTFFSGVASLPGQYDPKVIYDRISDRFVLVFLERSEGGTNVSNLLFAISDDSDPNGTWHRYSIDVIATVDGNECFIDYPGFGYNKDGYVICGNLFQFGGGASGDIEFVVVPKAPVLTGSAVTAAKLFATSTIGAQMAETVDPAKATVFGAALQTETSLRVYAVTGVDGGSPSLSSTLVSIPSSPWPGAAKSAGDTLLDTLGGSVFTAIWRGGSLYLANNYDVSPSNHLVGIRWYEIGTGNWPESGGVSLNQAGSYASASFNYFLPAINVNGHADVSMLFTGSNGSTAADVLAAGRASGDAPGTMSAATVLASSSGVYSRFRWGDYFGVDVDPADDETFWGTAMAIGPDGNWNTHVLSWTITRTTTVIPSGFLWTRGLLQSGDLASLGADDDDYCVARAGITLFLGEPPAQLIVDAVAPSGSELDLELSVVSKVNTPGLSQRIELWNFAAGRWDSAGEQLSTVSDSIHTAVAGGTVSDYVEPGTRALRAKVLWFQAGLTLVWPWTVSVDQIEWAIRSR